MAAPREVAIPPEALADAKSLRLFGDRNVNGGRGAHRVLLESRSSSVVERLGKATVPPPASCAVAPKAPPTDRSDVLATPSGNPLGRGVKETVGVERSVDRAAYRYRRDTIATLAARDP
jgi:hypothetical protein